MRFNTLDEWLSWQETLHPDEIELGLERVSKVWNGLKHDDELPFAVITVAGTNGKGSCVAMLDSILSAAGYKVGTYTSPHLLRYNERICVNQRNVDDEVLCEAFESVDQARGKTSLTYFEFGTLAALDIFQASGLDVVILEVGLGGRLDAVNIIDADIALISSIGIDHTEWLGDSRESIGREKAGIFRSGKPAVCGDIDPPASLIDQASQVGCSLYNIGKEFEYTQEAGGWTWRGPDKQRSGLPYPSLRGDIQLVNSASVLMVLSLLADRLPVSQDEIRQGLLGIRLPGRFQVFDGPVTRILDVTHNPDGAAVLLQNLQQQDCAGRTLAVLAMLNNKDAAGVGKILDSVIDTWYAAELAVNHGESVERLADKLLSAGINRAGVTLHKTVAMAYTQACADAEPGDRIIVFGSFHTVAEVIRSLSDLG